MDNKWYALIWVVFWICAIIVVFYITNVEAVDWSRAKSVNDYNFTEATYSIYNSVWGFWKNLDSNTITTSDLSYNLFLYNNLTFAYNSSMINGTGIVGVQVDYNWTFNSTTDTEMSDFDDGTFIYSNQTYQEGNITLDFNENNLEDTVLLMHFDNNYTQDYNLTDDVSIYDNNGVCKEMSKCPEFNSSGYIGGAFEFDGVDDWITADYNGVSNNFVISGWIKASSNGVSQAISSKYSSYIMKLDSSDCLVCTFYNATTNEAHTATTTETIPINTWKHVVCVNDGTNIKAYIDGVLDATTSFYGVQRLEAYIIKIGQYANVWYWNGAIDEFRIYKRALTEEEIRREYQKNIKKIPPSLNNYEHNASFTSEIFDLGKNPNMSKISWGEDIPHSSYYPQSNLIFGWDGAVNYSYSNTSIHLTASGGVMIGGNTSIFPDNNATWFDGVDDYVTIPNIPSLTSSVTFAGWIKLDDKTSDNAMGGASNEFILWEDENGANDRFAVVVYAGGGIIYGTTNPNIGEWYHVVFTDDGTTTKLYVNGLQEGDDLVDSISVNDVGVIYIGAGVSPTSKLFNGTIDEVHIYDRALSSNEINRMYNISKVKYPISMQTRIGSQADLSDGSWGNKTAIGGYYLNNSGENINHTWGEQYFQYRALFETYNTNSTPRLMDVNFTYYSNTTGFYYGEWLNQSNVTTIYNKEGDLYIKNDVYNAPIITGNGSHDIITTGNVTADNYIGEKLEHYGDSDTYLQFLTNQINFIAGARNVFNITNDGVWFRDRVELVSLFIDNQAYFDTDELVHDGDVFFKGDVYIYDEIKTGLNVSGKLNVSQDVTFNRGLYLNNTFINPLTPLIYNYTLADLFNLNETFTGTLNYNLVANKIATFNDKVTIGDEIYYTPTSHPIADEGNPAIPATYELNPTDHSYAKVDCQDGDGCDIEMGDGNVGFDGYLLTIICVSDGVGESCNFNDGVPADGEEILELKGGVDWDMGQYDVLNLMYVIDRWIEIGRSDN